jgi:hypothetical protein
METVAREASERRILIDERAKELHAMLPENQHRQQRTAA